MTLLISAIYLILVDAIFLMTSQPIFARQIQQIQGSPLHVYYRGVLPCYLLLILVLNYFILMPHKPVSDAFLLGLCIYGIYETTNYAILKDWKLSTVVIDTLWGGILFAIVTWLTYQTNNLFR